MDVSFLSQPLQEAKSTTNLHFVLICFGAVLGMAGQQIGIPLYLGSLGSISGPYFGVVWPTFIATVLLWTVVAIRVYLGYYTHETL